ncbi:MICOS complex subunit mic60 [Fusarium falciforme]|nr:MICOS complex subunit mic60 [Fusarium falciforme]
MRMVPSESPPRAAPRGGWPMVLDAPALALCLRSRRSPRLRPPSPRLLSRNLLLRLLRNPHLPPLPLLLLGPSLVSRPPRSMNPLGTPPLKPIDLLSLDDAREPVIQDLVHMVNDLILVINADGAHGRYGSSVSKAKNEITKVGGKLKAMKEEFEKKAAGQVRDKIDEFDKAATDLIDRVESAMITQESQWRHEFEEEMKKVRENYEDRVKVLLERERKLNEEKLQNQLLEQALALKKEFVKDVENQVEQERESRLGKLTALSSAVADLEKLTTGWNEVLDSNLKTQQLHVAVEAVRASLEDDHHPRPFIRELVALREIASDDPVVNAAIASVNPTAYQRGISTSSQLIDRFRRVANEVRKASLLPDEAGVASHASSWVLSHVMFKKQGLADGNDVESVLTRTQTYLEEGDLDSAAREMNGLEGWAKTLSKDWLGEVRKVLEVQQALDVIATEARLQSLRVD